MQKQLNRALLIMALAAIVSCLLFLFYGLSPKTMDYAFPRRIVKLMAFILTGAATGFSTTVFQTVTNNRILTPSIIGLDSLYLFIETLVIFAFGSHTLASMDNLWEFILTVCIMVAFSLMLFRILFKDGGRNLFTIILVGIICGSLFSSLSSFMQVLIDPNEFLIIQDKMFASFNNINSSLLGISGFICTMILIYGYSNTSQLDVLSFGRDISINLGVSYDKVVYRYMIMVSIMIAVSTALVGPITFLGLLTANLSRQLLKTYKHSILVTGSILISITALALGQFFVERILVFSTTISVIINFIGGIYFIFLLIREEKL